MVDIVDDIVSGLDAPGTPAYREARALLQSSPSLAAKARALRIRQAAQCLDLPPPEMHRHLAELFCTSERHVRKILPKAREEPGTNAGQRPSI